MRTIVICPTYNEIKNIAKLIQKILDDNHYDLLVIDDNSPDGTSEKVKEYQKIYKNLFLEIREGKQGLGTAYIHGFNWAIQKEYDSVVQMDADLSHNPKDLNRLIKNLKNNDLVIGSRYVQGVSVVNWPIRRLILSYGANIYTKFITGMPINDGTGGFKAWKVSLLKKIKLNLIKSQGYSFQIEMNFWAWVLNAKIIEIPIIFVDRTIGESKMSRKIMIEAILVVLKLRFLKIFRIL